jgi:hypothetical protein
MRSADCLRKRVGSQLCPFLDRHRFPGEISSSTDVSTENPARTATTMSGPIDTRSALYTAHRGFRLQSGWVISNWVDGTAGLDLEKTVERQAPTAQRDQR